MIDNPPIHSNEIRSGEMTKGQRLASHEAREYALRVQIWGEVVDAIAEARKELQRKHRGPVLTFGDPVLADLEKRFETLRNVADRVLAERRKR